MASVSCLPTRIIGIEAGHGVLEYHRDLIAAKLMEILLAHLEKILSVVYYLAAVDYGVAGKNAHYRPVGNGFSASGFADKGKSFSPVKVKADITHRLDLSRPVYGRRY